MSVQQSESTTPSPQDLEITAELPVLDVASADAEARDAQLGDTDTWSAPAIVAPAPADEDRQGELRALAERIRELEERLQQRSTRVLELEREIDGVHEERRAAAERVHAADDALRQLDERDARLRELEAHMAEHESLARSVGDRDRLITELRRELAQTQDTAASHLEMLQTLETLRGIEASGDLDRRSAEREAQLANLEAELAHGARHASELQSELDAHAARIDALTSEMHTLAEALRGERAGQERAAAERAEQLASHAEAIVMLKRELQETAARNQELEADVRAAEDTIHRLEAELRGKSQRIEELARASGEWREAAERAGRSPEEEARRPDRSGTDAIRNVVLTDVSRPERERAGTEPPPEGARRLLVRTVGGSDVVHVLGRKTTVGRTPDNDLQIDARFISRHHAVILAGPVQTIIEDLNSTNGVRVNSRRVTRQVLKDGDVVMIGKTRFRFSVSGSARA